MKIANMILLQIFAMIFALIGGLILGKMLQDEPAKWVSIGITFIYFSGMSAGMCFIGMWERIKKVRN